MDIQQITVTDITNIGDPFVLRVGDVYYLYATCFSDGFDCRTSRDLVHWSAPRRAYSKGERSFGYTDFWAPEVVAHNGRYVGATIRCSSAWQSPTSRKDPSSM